MNEINDQNIDEYTQTMPLSSFPASLMKEVEILSFLGNKEEALKYFTDIKENYDTTPEASSVDVLIGLAQ